MKPERQSVALNEEEKLVLDTIKKSDSKKLVVVKTAVV